MPFSSELFEPSTFFHLQLLPVPPSAARLLLLYPAPGSIETLCRGQSTNLRAEATPRQLQGPEESPCAAAQPCQNKLTSICTEAARCRCHGYRPSSCDEQVYGQTYIEVPLVVSGTLVFQSVCDAGDETPTPFFNRKVLAEDVPQSSPLLLSSHFVFGTTDFDCGIIDFLCMMIFTRRKQGPWV